MERAILTTENGNEFFKFLDSCPVKVKISIIQNEIIPLMNLRRGKNKNLTADEINKKLNQPASSGKAGEKVELWHELLARDGETIDPELACELADIAYYGLQPQTEEPNTFEDLYHSELLEFVGIPIDAILTFCILKYSTRLQNGDQKNYKDIEFNTVAKYLNLHQNLRDLWVVKGS